MSCNELDQPRAGTRDISVAVDPNTDFDRLVKVLQETLVVPEMPGVRGCAPCLSGLDRFVLQSAILPTLR